MEDQEKVIDKIRKILELSKNNPSQEEAQAAALKAQKMMAQYHIEMVDIESVSDIEEIDEAEYITHPGGKWKYALSSIIADNFRCKVYTRGKKTIIFYGYTTDCQIAKEVYSYLYALGIKLATKEYNKYKKLYGHAEGIMQAWYDGYLKGIKEVLGKQCTALMIVTPPEVIDAFAERTKDMKSSTFTMNRRFNVHNYDAYNSGYAEGKNAMKSRQIEGGN